MSTFGKILFGLAAALFVAGLLWELGAKRFPWGKLPGDIALERDNARFYFPIVTCILVSVILTLVLNLLARFFNK